MNAIDALGYTGALLSSLMLLPQAATVVRRRHDPDGLAGISWGSMALTLCNAVVWLVWALLSTAYPAGIPSLINGPVAVMALVILWRTREASGVSAPAVSVVAGAAEDSVHGCGWRLADGPHAIFVTAAPGYGSVVPCSGKGPFYGRPVATGAGARGSDGGPVVAVAA